MSCCVLGQQKEENMAGRPCFLIPLSTLPPLTSAISPHWPVLSITLQTPQLPCLLTVKVLTNHESCQYGGPLIRLWLAHESCHTCVFGACLARRTVHDGSPMIL